MDRMSLREELHLRTAVERLVREGCSQEEIEEVIARMTGSEGGQPNLSMRLRGLIGR